MENERLTQLTQDIVDPRREGRNYSGLSIEDISDVLCILHPCTPASFKLVAVTAKRAPQHVVQNKDYASYAYDVSPSLVEEQETFIIANETPDPPMDLALRFSSRTVQPLLGFTFGRSPQMCDIVVPSDTHKRISNFHFSISVTDSGVLMLSDMSTNGTVVDEVVLRGKKNFANRTRMLTPGSIIQILSPTPAECLKFIVRFPPREGHVEEYEANFQAYVQRIANLQAQHAARKGTPGHNLLVTPRPTSTAIRAPLTHNQYGMHWSGGEKYNVVGQVGKGAFACVYQLATKIDGQLFAAKELEKRKFMKNGILDRKLDNEMQIMKSLSHPNIVQYIDYQDVGNHLYIIMEFVACGDLQKYLGTQVPLNSPLPENMARRMAAQVFDALNYLHLKKITHRDIKPDNILIADLDPENFSVKLSDFGLSKVVRDDDTFLKTFCGTLLYCAPEVFPHYDEHVASKGMKRPRKGFQRPTKFHSYSQSVDVWSFGAVLWYALCLQPPFEGVTDTTGRGMFEKIMMTPLDATVLMKQGVSDDAVALLVQMLNTDPASRPTPAYCLKHPWFGHEPASAEELAIGLGVITEEAEGEMSPAGAPDVSRLSLNEQGDSQNSELSFNSGDMAFFDIRESKRFKPDDDAYRDPEELIDSSPEAFYQPIPIVNDTENKPKAGKPKLFGEISRSDLQNGAFAIRGNSTSGNVESSDGSVEHERRSQTSNQGSRHSSTRDALMVHSLMGAESQMGDMHMADSPYSSESLHSGDIDRGRSGAVTHGSTPSKASLPGNFDITPRPVQPAKMNRQINIPIPPSFFYEADDPSTHTIEYASKASGLDFTTNPLYSQLASNALHTKPPSRQLSRSPQRTQNNLGGPISRQLSRPPEPMLPATQPPSQSSPIDPSPSSPSRPLYGRLVSTPDSFAHIILDLNARMTKWGRDPNNTHVYPDPSDTRIPKLAIVLYFYAAGIDSHATQIDDWTSLPGLYTGLTTYSSYGLVVNGFPLRKAAGPDEDQPYARLHSGDVIEVCAPTRDGRAGLSFTCEFYYGQGKNRRAPGEEFKVEMGAKSKASKALVAAVGEREREGNGNGNRDGGVRTTPTPTPTTAAATAVEDERRAGTGSREVLLTPKQASPA